MLKCGMLGAVLQLTTATTINSCRVLCCRQHAWVSAVASH